MRDVSHDGGPEDDDVLEAWPAVPIGRGCSIKLEEVSLSTWITPRAPVWLDAECGHINIDRSFYSSQILVPFTYLTNLPQAVKRTDDYLHECINVFYRGNQNKTDSLGRWVISKEVQTSNLKPVATRSNLT